MILTLHKEQTGKEFIKEMEKVHGSIVEMEKKVKRTNNMVFYNSHGSMEILFKSS
ncbi:MAG: hypothetical protein FWH29_02905 [Methanobrevibacter sp.]|nr:hypothetical protein [Methanobrevibacter sp.]